MRYNTSLRGKGRTIPFRQLFCITMGRELQQLEQLQLPAHKIDLVFARVSPWGKMVGDCSGPWGLLDKDTNTTTLFFFFHASLLDADSVCCTVYPKQPYSQPTVAAILRGKTRK